MDTENGCEPLNRVEIVAKTKRRKKNVDPDKISIEKKAKQAAYGRPYMASLTDEQREKRRAYYRRRQAMVTKEDWDKKIADQRMRRAMFTNEDREKRNAYQRMRRATATNEDREKRRAYKRMRWAKATNEDREKEYVARRNRQAMETDETREKKKARDRRRRAMETEEQREKRSLYHRNYYEKRKKLKLEEKNSKLKDEQNDNQKTNLLCSRGKGIVEEYEADPQYPVEIEQGDVNDTSNLESERVKSSCILGERFETSSTAKVEICTSEIGPLDYFEECEDWRTRVKKENNAEE